MDQSTRWYRGHSHKGLLVQPLGVSILGDVHSPLRSIVAEAIVGELGLDIVVLPLKEEGDKVRLPLFLTDTAIDVEFAYHKQN